MNAVQHLAGQFLYWTQPAMFEMYYQLQDAERVQMLGGLKWLSWARERAVATVGEQQWHFDRLGFINRRVEIREGMDQEGTIIATYKPHWSGNGTLTFDDGRRYEWKNANAWRTQMEWRTADDGELMKFSGDLKLSRLTRTEAKIELTFAVADFPDAALLVPLGWYLNLLAQRDTAAAVGGA